MNKTKIIQIIIFTLIVILLAWALWWMFWRTPAVGPGDLETPTGPGGQLPGIGEGSPIGTAIDPITGLPVATTTKISTKPGTEIPTEPRQPKIDERALGGLTRVNRLVAAKIKAPLVGKNGQLNYYNEQDNKFYRLGADGKPELLSDKEFYNVENIDWSPNGNQAILEYPDSSNILYDFRTNKQVTLPRQMTEFNFSDVGDKIAFKWMSDLPNDDWLGISSPDGGSMNFIEPMNDAADDVQVGWSPNNQVVALYREGQGANQSQVYLIGQHGENFKSLTVRGRGFKGEWLDDGKNLLYQVYSDNTGSRPSLWLSRADGENIGLNNNPLGINTWIDKCTVSGLSAYCAVPESLPEGAAYVPEIADDIPDFFYRIDLETGARTLLARPAGDQDSYTASQLTLSADGKTLYFIDKQTGNLNSIDL